MKLFLSVFVIIFLCLSCNDAANKNDNSCDIAFEILNKENTQYNLYLSENIHNILLQNKDNPDVLRYDSLTREYLDYIAHIENEIIEKSSIVFFEKENYSSKGKEFINATKSYQTEIEKLVKNENLKKRINLILNTNDVQSPIDKNEIARKNESGEIIPGKVYIKFLDYYFRGFSKHQTLLYLTQMKRSVLELQNEFTLTSLER